MAASPAPPNDFGFKVVSSFNELVSTPFAEGVNALCWQRTLAGDFNAVVAHLMAGGDIETLDESALRGLPLTAAGKLAVDTLVQDLERLRERGLDPVLDCIHRYPRDEDGGPVPTDVYSFHADSATTQTDTYLCSYTVSSSLGLRTADAIACVNNPVTRLALLQSFGGEDGPEFLQFLKDHCYDLHYEAAPGAKPYSFGLGNLWRIAVEYPGSPVPPCIHRAPDTVPGEAPRLLLIS
jgi:hypothetical protein